MKEKYSFTIENSLMEEFREIAKKDCLNMSAFIESKIREYVERRIQDGKFKNFAASNRP